MIVTSDIALSRQYLTPLGGIGGRSSGGSRQSPVLMPATLLQNFDPVLGNGWSCERITHGHKMRSRRVVVFLMLEK